MKENEHLSDIEIQQYALGEAMLDTGLTKHIDQCAHCSGRAALYREMAIVIAATPEPVFDFELVPAILAKLPVRKSRHSPALILGSIATISIMTCIFTFYYLNAVLLNAMLSNHGATTYAIVLTCGLLFIFLTADLWREHSHKLSKLHVSGTLQQNLRGAV